jgi:hypothetical protein
MSNFVACCLLLTLTAEICQGFISPATPFRLRTIASSVSELSELSLTPQLEKYVTGFKNVADDKIRYQQLFFLATKCQPMDNSFKIEENKVAYSRIELTVWRRDFHADSSNRIVRND